MALSKLPIELLIEIFSYLDYCTIQTSINRVCRSFHYAASTFNFRRLTPDLWAAIFGNLDYLDLVFNVGPTCKPFYRITKRSKNPKLASKLFREDIASSSLKYGAQAIVHAHPALYFFKNDSETKIDEVRYRKRSGATYRLSETICANENATSPPSSRIIVRFGYSPEQIISTRHFSNPRPITVLEVMQATCNAMAMVTLEEDKEYYLGLWDIIENEYDDLDLGKFKSKINSYRELPQNRASYEFPNAKSSHDGTICLGAPYFRPLSDFA